MRVLSLFLALGLVVQSVSAQSILLTGVGSSAGSSFPALTLGTHAHTDNASSSSATVSVSITPQQAGSVLACAIKWSNLAALTSVADNINSGNYAPLVSGLREPNHNYNGAIYYHENVAASATTVSLTYAPAEPNGQMACVEVQNVPTSYAADSSFVASQAILAANPTTGSTLTPAGSGRFLFNALLFDSGTTTAGSGFTLIENAGTATPSASDALYPEYVIQTSATASNGSYTNATGTNAFAALMSAFAPKQSGLCGASMVLDWSAGSNGSTPASADLQSSTHGNKPQPNSDRCLGCNGGATPGGWTNVGAAGITYSSTGFQALQTARHCPFYTIPGTSSVGLVGASSTTTSGPTIAFDSSSATTTAFGCFMTDTPIANAGTFDLWRLGVNDNSDFVNIQMNSNGGSGTFLTEMPSGTVSTPTINWSPNTWYGIRLTETVGGTNKSEFYTYSGAGCSGTPTLIGTQTGAHSAGTLRTNSVTPLGASADTYTAGTHFYSSAVLVDYLYGSATLAY
jgi:hypothetical protein